MPTTLKLLVRFCCVLRDDVTLIVETMSHSQTGMNERFYWYKNQLVHKG